MIMKLVDVTAGLCGVGVTLAQAIPGVPEDFKSWPATAVLGLIALACIAAGVFERRMAAKALSALATGVTKLSVELGQANTRSNEIAMKIGQGNDLQAQTFTILKARPCLADDVAKAIRDSIKKTQHIRVEPGEGDGL